jgi:hypothetical protein
MDVDEAGISHADGLYIPPVFKPGDLLVYFGDGTA